jgi:hypothetical protein
MKRSLVKRIFAILIVVCAIVAIGSCSIAGSSIIEVANTSSIYTIAHVYITRHSSTIWGNDWLSPDVIVPGSSALFDVSPGLYDVSVVDTTPYTAFVYSVEARDGDTVTLFFNGVTLN